MTREQLAEEIAKGIINTHIEGDYDTVTCSTAGNYPSIGVSQWEGDRANNLLSWMDGGKLYMNRTYEDLRDSGDLYGLKELLNSEQGRYAQLQVLSHDCLSYVDTLWEVPTLDLARPTIYAGMWCPTSTYVVQQFCMRRAERGYNLRSLEQIYELFREQYAYAAGVSEYQIGYANRAGNTYEYVSNLDLSQYGE